jgi:periplasmic protein TonB
MFEDSTFESTGRIKTRSRRWMFATLIFNGSILVILILLPLIYPDALPTHMLPVLMVAPEAPKPEVKPEPVKVSAAAQRDRSEMNGTHVLAPPRIPQTIKYVDPGEKARGELAKADLGVATPGGDGANPFGNGHPVTVVHPPVPASIHLSSKLVEGLLIYKSIPQYPAIAKAAHVEGTVVLQATISKTGTIDNLRAVSGPAMLQQAAIDAVSAWRYRPYMLNQQPVDVETTINVIFKLER